MSQCSIIFICAYVLCGFLPTRYKVPEWVLCLLCALLYPQAQHSASRISSQYMRSPEWQREPGSGKQEPTAFSCLPVAPQRIGAHQRGSSTGSRGIEKFLTLDPMCSPIGQDWSNSVKKSSLRPIDIRWWWWWWAYKSHFGGTWVA